MERTMANFSARTRFLNKSVAVLAVRGFIDANTFDDFDQSLNELFENSTYKVIVDFSKLEYISSAGVGVLIGALSIVREHAGEIVIVGPEKGAREIFDLLGIAQMFNIVSGMDEALKFLGVERSVQRVIRKCQTIISSS